MLVVKLGGSLAETGRLQAIIDIVAHATLPVVIVPGGGPFADAVRTIQPQLQIPDALAHKLALLSMHQMGLVIASRHARFRPCLTLDAMGEALALGAIPVWLPIALQYDDATLPADWTVTSDALAARLAERMGGGARVALVKSCVIARGATLDQLAADGIVDRVFSLVVRRAGLDWHVFGTGDEGELVRRIGQSFMIP